MLPWLMEHGKREIFEEAQGMGFAFAYVAAPEDILQWEHLRGRDYFTQVHHPEVGSLDYPTGPYKAEGIKWNLEPAPLLGQHNHEVYFERLGYTDDDLVRMRESGVI